jgi:hypothetical protein
MRTGVLRFLRSTGAAVLLAGSLFVSGPATGALAAAGGWSAQLNPSTQAPTRQAVLASYPYDCVPRSDNPHQSSTVGGVVDGKGWVVCRNQRPYEHVDSTLSRQDCWWIFCVWSSVGYDSQTGPPSWFTYGTVRALAIYSCNGSATHKYVLRSYHRVVDYDGTGWNSWTSSPELTLACG